jgi:hypothetical protein
VSEQHVPALLLLKNQFASFTADGVNTNEDHSDLLQSSD